MGARCPRIRYRSLSLGSSPVCAGSEDTDCCDHARYAGCKPTPTAPVPEPDAQPGGTPPLGDTPEHLHHMADNVREWVADADKPYPSTPQTDPRIDDTGAIRVVRGGGFKSSGNALTVWHRDREDAKHKDSDADDIGFRCALSLP